jgi:hypothetical protein
LNLTNVKVTAANSFDYGAVLQDMGANGTTPGAIVTTIGSRVVNADMVNDSSVFADIRYRETAGNDAMDNLSINTLDGPVVFLAHPRSQTVLQGRPATINAYIDGTPPFTYQWLKDGADIPGATDWQYKIAAVSAANAGSYALRVTGTNGVPLTSDAGVLTGNPRYDRAPCWSQWEVWMGIRSAFLSTNRLTWRPQPVPAITLSAAEQPLVASLCAPTKSRLVLYVAPCGQWRIHGNRQRREGRVREHHDRLQWTVPSWLLT